MIRTAKKYEDISYIVKKIVAGAMTVTNYSVVFQATTYFRYTPYLVVLDENTKGKT